VQVGDVVKCSGSWLCSYGAKYADEMRAARGAVVDVWTGGRVLWASVVWRDGSPLLPFYTMPVWGLEVMRDEAWRHSSVL
jgi:hypothetical protein